MKNLRSSIELALNIVITVAIVVVAVVTVKRYLSPSSHQNADAEEAQVLIGTRMMVPGLDRGPNKKNLVLFVRKDCPACGIAAPLYRELIAEASKRGVKRVVILPDPLEEGMQYLRSLGLKPDHVQSAVLSSYNISSVPTAVVLDGDGVVEGAWIGAAPGRESEIRSKVVAVLATR